MLLKGQVALSAPGPLAPSCQMALPEPRVAAGGPWGAERGREQGWRADGEWLWTALEIPSPCQCVPASCPAPTAMGPCGDEHPRCVSPAQVGCAGEALRPAPPQVPGRQPGGGAYVDGRLGFSGNIRAGLPGSCPTSVHLEVWVPRAFEPRLLPGTLPTDREAWGLQAGEYPGGPYVSPAWPAPGPWGRGVWRHRQAWNRIAFPPPRTWLRAG